MRWGHNIRVLRTGVGQRLHWGLKDPRELERWSEGVRLLDALYPFQYPEPRMQEALKMRVFRFLRTAVGIYHYQL